MVLGVEWLLALGDIVWNFSSLTMQFNVGGKSCVLQGIVPGSLATGSKESNPRCFAVMGKSLGPYTTVLSSPAQVTLGTLEDTTQGSQLQKLLMEFDDIFQMSKGLPPSRKQDHKIPLVDEGTVIKMRPYRYPACQKTETRNLSRKCSKLGSFVTAPVHSPLPLLWSRRRMVVGGCVWTTGNSTSIQLRINSPSL